MWPNLWPMRYSCSIFLNIICLLSLIFTGIVTSTNGPIQAFRKINDTLYVNQGDSATLTCRINSSIMGSYKVMWTFKTKTLTLSKSILTSDERFSILHNDYFRHGWDLRIEHVRRSDEGAYYCIINTDPPQRRLVKLEVMAPPKIIGKTTFPIETISEGYRLRVECNAIGKPKPKIIWTHENSDRKTYRIGSKNHSKGIYTRGGTLIIARANRSMEGAYVCTASNGVEPPAIKKLTLTVQFKPVVTFVNSRIGQQLGGTTMLQCRIEGNPMADINWEFNKKVLDPELCNNIHTMQRICKDILQTQTGPLKKQVDLMIRNVTLADYGEYACVATSEAGVARAYANLYKIYPLGIENRHRRLYQNDATKGYRTPAPLSNQRDRVETLVPQNTAKPHITAGRNEGPSLCEIYTAFIFFSATICFLPRLPCCSKI